MSVAISSVTAKIPPLTIRGAKGSYENYGNNPFIPLTLMGILKRRLVFGTEASRF
jgi:hypothetical protein